MCSASVGGLHLGLRINLRPPCDVLWPTGGLVEQMHKFQRLWTCLFLSAYVCLAACSNASTTAPSIYMTDSITVYPRHIGHAIKSSACFHLRTTFQTVNYGLWPTGGLHLTAEWVGEVGRVMGYSYILPPTVIYQETGPVRWEKKSIFNNADKKKSHGRPFSLQTPTVFTGYFQSKGITTV